MRVIDQLVVQWYADTECKTPIHEYIGITLAEYDDFSNHGKVPDGRPDLSAEYKVPPPPGGRYGGAVAPPGHPVQTGYAVPAKRET